MKKWILNHLKLTVAVLSFLVTLIILGSVMLSSYISYKNGKQQRNNGKFQEYLDESIEKIKNNDDKKSLIDLNRDIISMYTSQTENIEEKVL